MTEPIWLSVFRAFEGLREISGPSSNPLIVKWARDIHAPDWYHDDDQPWCAVALNRILLACQVPMAGQGFDLLRAKSFTAWGQVLATPSLGAVMVFDRPGGAHVGLYLGEREHDYRVYGGNTSDAVAATWIAKDRCNAIRWPEGQSLPLAQRVRLTDDGKVAEMSA